MAKASGSIDLKSLKVAGEGASKYITSIDSNNGIQVHAVNNSDKNYVQINNNGMEIFQNVDNSTESSTERIAKFSETVLLGRDNNLRLKLEAGLMSLLNDFSDAVFSVEEHATSTITRNATVVTFTDSSSIDQTTRYIVDGLVVAGDVTVNFNTGGDSFVLSSSECTTVVTPGSSVSVALTQAGADRALELMTAASEEAGESVSATIDVDYTISHFDEALMSMDGSATINGEGRILNAINNDWTNDNKSNTFICAENKKTGKGILFGVGSGGQNRGIYDNSRGIWMLFADENGNTVINGKNFNVTTSGNIVTKGYLSLLTNGKAISFADKNGKVWPMLYMNNSDVFVFGYKMYEANKGETRIFADTLRLYSHNMIDVNAPANFKGRVVLNHNFWLKSYLSGTTTEKGLIGLTSDTNGNFVAVGASNNNIPVGIYGTNVTLSRDGNLNLDGSVTTGGHNSPIGTIRTGTRTSSAGTAETSYTTAASVVVYPGTWHIEGFVSFNGGTAGKRSILITNNSASTTDAGEGSACSYAPADYQMVVRSSLIVSVSSNTTYYLRTKSSKTVDTPYGNLTAVRIS